MNAPTATDRPRRRNLLRDYPVPTALLGAGLGWLLWTGSRARLRPVGLRASETARRAGRTAPSALARDGAGRPAGGSDAPSQTATAIHSELVPESRPKGQETASAEDERKISAASERGRRYPPDLS